MTKEEKIKEAWGEYWERLSDVQKLLALDNNGYTSIGYSEYQSKLHVDLKKSKLFDVDSNTRPKLLQGIETNNGWIKIESEDDLPKEYGEYYFRTTYNTMITYSGWYSSSDKKFYDRNHYFEIIDVTHYQPIVKPLKPIY